MRAVRFDAFGAEPYLAEVPMPRPVPGGGVIRVMASGLCRSDWHGWQGHDPDITALPHIPGHEFAGVVEAVGEGVTRVGVGDRIVLPFVCGCGDCTWCASGNAQVCPRQWQPGFNGPGSYAEYVSIPHIDFNAVAMPEGMSFLVAASLGCRFATAFRAVVDVAQVQRDEWVAVFGCGGVGLAAVMVAASRGAHVVAVDLDARALALAEQAGAAITVDAAVGDAAAAVRAHRPNGVDVSIDALGSVGTASAAVRSLRIQGRHVQVGLLPPASIGDRATVPMHTVISRELSVFGSHGMAASSYPRMLTEVDAGRLDPGLFITRTISLEEAPSALMEMSERTEPGVTIVVP